MSSPPARDDSLPAREFQILPAFLSYLVPGLGQIAQGRVFKGVVFFGCVLTLFYYGLYLGSWSNVYVNPDETNPFNLPAPLGKVYNRPQIATQFFVGISAWPAVYQAMNYDPLAERGPVFGTYQRIPYETRATRPERPVGADPADRKRARFEYGLKPTEALPDWKGKTLNELQNEGDKTWDLGWVFTVIAGALNIMVIYDALAGPAFVVVPEPVPQPQT